MSTWAYAKLTKKESGAGTGTSTSTSPPGLSTYIDMVAALVPAEVLAAHATILSFTSKTVRTRAGSMSRRLRIRRRSAWRSMFFSRSVSCSMSSPAPL